MHIVYYYPSTESEFGAEIRVTYPFGRGLSIDVCLVIEAAIGDVVCYRRGDGKAHGVLSLSRTGEGVVMITTVDCNVNSNTK